MLLWDSTKLLMDCFEELLALKCMGVAQMGGAKVLLPPLHFQLSRYTLIEQSATLIEQSCIQISI